MQRRPHENVATVLVDPSVLGDLELELMALDLRVWPVVTAAVYVDGPRMAFQVRRRLVEGRRGAWDDAEHWVAVWVGFGPRWRDGDEPLPWAAHQTLWDALERYAGAVRYQRRLVGVPRMTVPGEPSGGLPEGLAG